MATYTSTPIKAARSDAQGMRSSSKGTVILIVALALSLGVGGYGWNDLHKQVQSMQQDLTKLKAQVNTVNTAAQRGLVGVAGGAGGGGGRGAGRGRGANVAAMLQNLGLDDATVTQLTELATERTTAMQAARTDAQNQGITQYQDPAGYQALIDAATASVDAKIGALSPDALALLQQQGGRRGGGGAGGGFGGGGFGGGGGPGGGGFGGGAAGGFGGGGGAGGGADPNAGN